jgi:hypothetical protein
MQAACVAAEYIAAPVRRGCSGLQCPPRVESVRPTACSQACPSTSHPLARPEQQQQQHQSGSKHCQTMYIPQHLLAAAANSTAVCIPAPQWHHAAFSSLQLLHVLALCMSERREHYQKTTLQPMPYL